MHQNYFKKVHLLTVNSDKITVIIRNCAEVGISFCIIFSYIQKKFVANLSWVWQCMSNIKGITTSLQGIPLELPQKCTVCLQEHVKQSNQIEESLCHSLNACSLEAKHHWTAQACIEDASIRNQLWYIEEDKHIRKYRWTTSHWLSFHFFQKYFRH